MCARVLVYIMIVVLTRLLFVFVQENANEALMQNGLSGKKLGKVSGFHGDRKLQFWCLWPYHNWDHFSFKLT